MKAKILLAIFCAISLSINAIEDVTLTTVGDGSTREEAVNNALRSALEQAYGAFMSSSTLELNDVLQKDEIVSTIQGNIKKYQILGVVQGTDGLVTATCTSTVSLSKLLSYMESTGAEVSFSGTSFAANLQLEELNRKSEAKALSHLTESLSKMRGLCDYELELGEPKIEGDNCKVDGRIYFKYNSQSINYGILLYNTLSQLHAPDGKYEVPNLGNFRLRNPLPEKLINDLEIYLTIHSNCVYRTRFSEVSGEKIRDLYKNYIFLQDILRFSIYDNLHPDIELFEKDINILFDDFHFCDNSKEKYDTRDATVYLPYACVPSKYKLEHGGDNLEEYKEEYPLGRGIVGYHTYFRETPKMKEKISNGILAVKILSSEQNASPWWNELKVPFYYPQSVGYNIIVGYCNRYAQVGEIYAYLPFYMTISTSEIAKYSNFGIRYNSKKEEDMQKYKERQEFEDLMQNYQRGLSYMSNYDLGLLENQIASCYIHGRGVDEDEVQAFSWWLKSAKHGNINSMTNVGGFCYLFGNGCEPNPKEALFWLEKAKNLGDNSEWTIKRYNIAYNVCRSIEVDGIATDNLLYEKLGEIIVVKNRENPNWELYYDLDMVAWGEEYH